MIFFVYCIVSLFYYVSLWSPGPTWYIFLLLWHFKHQANKLGDGSLFY